MSDQRDAGDDRDALDAALDYLSAAEEPVDPGHEMRLLMFAQACAAVAVAQQQKRVADALEAFLRVLMDEREDNPAPDAEVVVFDGSALKDLVAP